MMTKNIRLTLCVATSLIGGSSLWAAPTDTDSVSTQSLNSVEIVSSGMRTVAPLWQQPLSYSAMRSAQIEQYRLHDITALTARVPGLYIPDYGSKRSTAVYLRGSGSRTTGQTIGFYVDGVPVLKKEAFNFDLRGVHSIEVLRGPQGTLYGLNAMSGIININTHSPIESPRALGLTLGAGNYNNQYIGVEHRSKLSDQFGFGVQAGLSKRDGYFFNETRKQEQDDLKQAHLSAKLEYRPTQTFRAMLSVDGEYIDQGAFPYRPLDRKTGQLLALQSNEEGRYKRKSVASRLRLTKDSDWWRLESATGYQFLDDQMSMDMDQTSAPIFRAEQSLRQHALSQEFVFKSNDKASRYQWVFGAFGFYDNSTISTPIIFKPMAVRMLFQSQIDAQRKKNPAIPDIRFGTPAELPLANEFKKPEWGTALYHESTVRDVLTPGLSVTAGVRADYSHQKLDLGSLSTYPISIAIPHTQRVISMDIPVDIHSQADQGQWHVLPKVALQYTRSNYSVYATFSQGFKSGGYNEQSIMEAIPKALMYNIMNFRAQKTFDATEVAKQLAYKPELSWNYEVGGRVAHLGFLQSLSLAVFYTHANNLQVTNFINTGAGRITTNAGTSKTYGVELSANVNILGELNMTTEDYLGLSLNYSYNHARFKGAEVEGFVPFIPRYTYSALLSGNKVFGNNRLFVEVEANGLGKTYWTQDNTQAQSTYLLTNARIGVGLGKSVILSLWGKNLLGASYTAFQASSNMGNYQQLGAPRTFGIETTYNF